MKINIQRVIKCLTCLVTCFMLVVACMTTPANAATILSGNYDPADYIHDIVISGDTKTIRYDFSDIRYGFFCWDSKTNYSFTTTDSINVQIPDDSAYFTVQAFPFGNAFDATASNLSQSAHGCLYVGDILPNSDIAYNFTFDVTLTWDNADGEPFSIQLHCYHYLDIYDADGNYIRTDTVASTVTSYDVDATDVGLQLTDTIYVSGSFPAVAAYVRPRLRFSVYNSGTLHMVELIVQGGHTALSVDINTVLENSNQMAAIKDKLNDILTGTPEQNEDADNAKDELDNKKDQIEDLVDQMTPSKPDTDSVDTDIGAIAGDVSTELLADGLAPILNHEIILSMLTIVCAVCLVGYVLFGKGG